MTDANKKANRIWMSLLIALAMLALLAVWRTAQKSMQMQTVAAGSAEVQGKKPGEAIKVVLEVADSTSVEIHGKLLEKQDETHYVRTATEVRVGFDTSTPVVMGKAADLHPGAIIHVSGTVNTRQAVEAKQIVILTGYVQVR